VDGRRLAKQSLGTLVLVQGACVVALAGGVGARHRDVDVEVTNVVAERNKLLASVGKLV